MSDKDDQFPKVEILEGTTPDLTNHFSNRFMGLIPPEYKFEDATFSNAIGHKIGPGSEKVTVDINRGEAKIKLQTVQPIYKLEYKFEFEFDNTIIEPVEEPFDQERYEKSKSEALKEFDKIEKSRVLFDKKARTIRRV
jgi:hypothetical protein